MRILLLSAASAALLPFAPEAAASLRPPDELSRSGVHGLPPASAMERHTLFEAVAMAEQNGGTPVGASFSDDEGSHLATVDVAYAGAAEGEILCEVMKSDVTEKTLKPLARPCVFRGELRRVQNERAALALVPLPLSDAIALVECTLGGEVRSARPVVRGSETLFLLMVRESNGRMIAAFLDPLTSKVRCSTRP